MTISFLKIVSILWANRAIIAAAIPLVLNAQKAWAENADKKKWVGDRLEELKKFTPDQIDEGIDAAVHLLKLGNLL